MHLGNGAITPECVVLSLGVGAAGLAASAAALRREVSRDKLILAAGLGTVVFAAQALNVPVGMGMSAHLVGGVLLAWMLGPGLGAWTMAAVLLIQALVLGDGGLSALGANVLNMAILPAALVSLAKSRSLTTAALLAGAAVPLAAALIVVETALFRPLAEVSAFGSFATAILGAHLWIGVLEAAATASLIAALSWTAQCSPVRTGWRLALACVSAALLLAALSSISSRLPDGYEAAAQASGQERLLAE